MQEKQQNCSHKCSTSSLHINDCSFKQVSVLMPVYNTERKFLKNAIDSILSQTFTNFEFLILNDGSENDDVEKTILSFSDQRIKYLVNEKNEGIAFSRNKLIESSSGEYLAIMDHDDISLPERFAKEVKYLDENRDIGVVSSWRATYGKKKKVKDVVYDKDIKETLLTKFCICHPAAMIRRSILTNNNIKYEKEFFPCEDYALWCRLIPKTKFYIIPEFLFEYREYSCNTSNKFRDKARDMAYAVREFARKENPEIWNSVKVKATNIMYVKLFRYVPFLMIAHKGNRTSVFLFNIIPLIYWNTKCEL